MRSGIGERRTVVVYGHDAWDAWTFALRLEARGHAVLIFEAGWADWAADESLPVERLPRYDRLIHTDWLHELIAGGRPEGYDGNRFLLFHVNFGVPEEYADGHLPGAHYLDTNWLEDPADWNRRPAQELEAALRALGITHDTTVILYGRDTIGQANEKWPGRRAGQIAATRAAAILHYAGVDDVRLLDGGYDWWVTAGHPLETRDSSADAGRELRSDHPEASGGHRRHRRGEVAPRRSRGCRPRQRANLAGAHRCRQRLQLHRSGGPNRGRRVGQLRLGRVPHAALPQRRQHDAGVPRDRRQLGGRRHHARTSASPSIAGPGGEPARPGSTPT